MHSLVELLTQLQLTLGVAESLTAGLFCSKIAEVANASAVFKGGVVAYSNEAKQTLLQVDPALLKQHGAVSAHCVVAMAQSIAALLACDIGVAFSGNAGPRASEDKAIGLFFTAIAYHGEVRVFEDQIAMERNALREHVCVLAQERIEKWIGETNEYSNKEIEVNIWTKKHKKN
ncbi:MAG: CinA family protein [Erysipelotrichaceae bacterium]